jgi:integrase
MRTERVVFTDRFLKSRKPAPKGKRTPYYDAIVPGLDALVTDTGHVSFGLKKRFPANPRNPTRRALGDYGAITLEQARQKARDWLALIHVGVDPKVEDARQRAAEQRRQRATFDVVAQEYVEREVPKLAHAVQAERIIRREFLSRWRGRPAVDILPEEAAAAVRAIVKRGAPAQARNAFGHGSRLFNWAIGTHEFGIISSPFASLRVADLAGKKLRRNRTLSDAELRAVWQATDGRLDAGAIAEARRRDVRRDVHQPIAYPYGPLVQLMILTGQREREIADMTWSEVDFDKALWVIPATRMKGARAHAVPLAPQALALLKALPRFVGDYVFTTTGGAKPVSGFSKTKERLDKLSGVSSWVLHDLRRTMRTHLSALPIEDRVREHMIAHAQPGLHQVYDRYAYSDEKRRGFELWEERLRGLLYPKPAGGADVAEERAQLRA